MQTRAVTNQGQARWSGDQAAHRPAHQQRDQRVPARLTGHPPTAAATGGAARAVDTGRGTGPTTRAAGRAGAGVPGAAARQVALPPPGDPTAPGPFSLGEPDRIATVLRAAALSDVVIEPLAEPLWMGPDAADTVAFLKSTGIWNSLLRGADPAAVARASQAVQAALQPHLTPAGVLLGSRAWLATASRPWR